MPRLSLYRPNRQNDYKFIDRTVAEMYQVGGVDMFVHKYLGPKPGGDDSSSISGGTQDATQPAYSSENPLFIEDLFLLENRDRSYSSDVYQTDASPCITANGFNVCEHGEEDTIAANFLKFGTRVRIPELFGDRIFYVRDRMNARYPERVDIWMKDYINAKQFGVKYAVIEIVVE